MWNDAMARDWESFATVVGFVVGKTKRTEEGDGWKYVVTEGAAVRST